MTYLNWHMCDCACEFRVPQRSEGIRSPGTRVISGCELLKVGAGNETPGLWRSHGHSKHCSKPRPHILTR